MQVIAVSTNMVVQQIPVGGNPLKMWTAHDGQRLYVSNHGSNTISVIDPITWQVLATVSVGINPRNLCTSPSDSLLYVANWGSASVSVVDAATYQVVHTVPVDYFPQAIWPTPDGRYVLVANFGFDLSYDHISVIRTSDHVVIARLRTGVGPEDMVTLGDDGQYLYVSNWGMSCCFNTAWDACCTGEVNEGNVTVIAMPDFEQWVAPDSIPLEIPYIRSTLTTVPTQAEYAFGMARHPNGRYVFAVNMNSNSMSVIGLQDLGATMTEADEQQAFTAFPNPARDFFQIGTSMEMNSVRLLDAIGRAVRKWPAPDQGMAFSLNGVSPGTYLLEVVTDARISFSKLDIE